MPSSLTPDIVRLDGRVAVVTGGAAGIGRASALALARFGADLAIIDRDEPGLQTVAAEITEVGRRCVTVVGDVRVPETVEGFAAAVRAEYDGGIHILVNNAGGGFQAAFADINPKGDDALLRENLLSVVWVTRAFEPQLVDGASVINLTSVEAHRAAPGFSIYSAAKAGVDQLCRTLALEFGDRGIRVNAIAPDLISTPGVGDLTGVEAAALRRSGTADEVAGAVLFLAGDLSTFVTGSTVHVNGGSLAAAGWKHTDDGWRA